MDPEQFLKNHVPRKINIRFRDIQRLRQGESKDNLTDCHAQRFLFFSVVTGTTTTHDTFLESSRAHLSLLRNRFWISCSVTEYLLNKKPLFGWRRDMVFVA